MNFDDCIVVRAFTMLAQNGALAIRDFAKMNGMDADEAEGLFIALSAALSDESVSTELGYMGASGSRFAWNPRPGGHGQGPKTRLSPGEDAALRAALEDFGMSARDPLWAKLFEAKGARGAGAGEAAAAPAGAGARGDAGGGAGEDADGAAGTCGGEGGALPGARGSIVSALSVLASTIDLEEHRLVSFAYRPAGAAESSVRRVAPVRIVSDGDVSLLQAWRCGDAGLRAAPAGADAAAETETGAGGPGPCACADVDRAGADASFAFRSYRIDRMEDVRVLQERFDPAALPQEGAQGKPRTVRLRFSDAGAVPEWPGMKLVKKAPAKGAAPGNDGATGSAADSAGIPADASESVAAGVEARIPWYGSDWLPQRIAALGGACTPLDDELRARVLAYIDRVRA